MADIIDRIKYQYKTGDILIRLIFINVGIFLIIKILGIFLRYSK